MKIKISDDHLFRLATLFAGEIHAAVIAMHLRRANGIRPREEVAA